MAKKKTSKTAVKKKKWISIKARAPFEGALIGETYVSDPALQVGTKMSVSMNAMTGEHNRQNLQLKFLISEAQEGVLIADLLGAYMLQTTLKKLVRRNKDKIDVSVVVKTKEGKPVRVKVLATTRYKTTGVVLTKLVKLIMLQLKKVVGSKTFIENAQSFVSRQFSKELARYLKKTYPISMCEVRSFELLGTTEGLVPPSSKEEPKQPETTVEPVAEKRKNVKESKTAEKKEPATPEAQ
ncbi:hypothetical protein GF342_03055 [Candidatus Woesearchaeota archaeon]|nr:hypothetical protein [Candidatus Woesearchaeota archaeon]